MHGKFCWYDIMTTDTAAATKFYGDVVGWATQDSGQTDKPYTFFTIGDRPVAGLMDLPEDVKRAGGSSAWMGYIEVEAVGAAASQLEGLGGTVHRPSMTIPGAIEFAVVADPQGAVFLLAKPLAAAATPLPDGTPGTVGWRELYAGDWVEAFAFYEKIFGWTKTTALEMGPMGTYQVFAIDGSEAGGMMTKPPPMPRPFWAFYFNVPAIDAAVERVQAGGGAILQGPMEVPGGGQWIVQARDPQGAYFCLVAPTRA